MTYPLLSLSVVGIGILSMVLALLLRADFRRGLVQAVVPWLLALFALLVLTAVFDNVMIAVGLFHYSAENRSGLQIGLAPLEDFSYPVSAMLMVAALQGMMSRPGRGQRR